MAQSNINTMYEGITAGLADRAKLIHRERPELDTYECIDQAINDEFIYETDRAYVVAHYMINGGFRFGEQINWEELWEEFTADIMTDYEE